MKKQFTLDTPTGQRWQIQLTENAAGLEIVVNGKPFRYATADKGKQTIPAEGTQGPFNAASTADLLTVVAPMPGVVLSLAVNIGQAIQVDETLLTLSAMKMENEIVASRAGLVERVLVAVNESVQAGQPLVVVRGVALSS